MNTMKDIHPKRKHYRLLHFDYSSVSSYFITICTAEKRNLFWAETCDGTLSEKGLIVEEEILALPHRFCLTSIDKYVIMPDHVHLIITLFDSLVGADTDRPQPAADFPPPVADRPNIKNVVGCLKAKITKRIGHGASVWQKSFYDHVIRSEKDYANAWDYIDNNPVAYICSKET